MRYHVHTANGGRVTREPVARWIADRIVQDARQQWGYAYEARPAVTIEAPKAWESQIYVDCDTWAGYLPTLGL